ncbi:mitochondrial carrier domain-containing protein [Gaertneriomyces semiglobifer]|nr:mitochondrial carrier domain-containing protein [Gaertneriomyces semiglobifer]
MAATPKIAEKPLPMHYSLAAGAIAGVTEILAMYPLDVVKTRFQLQVGHGEKNSIFGSFKQIVKSEGPAALYRGILPPIMVEAPKRAIKFGANDAYKRLYQSKFGFRDSQGLAVLTGVSAGATEALVVVSFDLIKIRLQDKANAGKYKNTMHCVSTIMKEEGIRGFFKGLESTVWRHAMWNGGYFGVIKSVRTALPEPETHQGLLLKNFTCGTIGGTVGTLLNTPFDVVKTRVQSQVHPPYKYGWAFPAIAKIAREEGARALYKGFVPKVLRLGPGGGILLVVYDFVTGYMRK